MQRVFSYPNRLLAVCAAVLLFVMLPVSAQAEKFRAQVVLDLPWGSGPGEIGYAKDGPEGAEGLRYGPSSFAVAANGDICILDTNNKRVLLFAPDGDLERSFSLPSRLSVDIALDDRGHVWMPNASYNAILEYAPDGNLLRRIKYGACPRPSICLHTISLHKGTVYLDDNLEIVPDPETATIGRHGEMVYKAVCREPMPNGGMGRVGAFSGNTYDITTRKDGNEYLVITDSKGTTRVVRPAELAPGVLCDYVGEDDSGNIYLTTRVRNQPWPFEIDIRKYSPELELLATGRLPENRYYTEVPKSLVLTDRGDVYYLLTSEHGVKVFKFALPSS